MNKGLDICPTNALGFIECPSGTNFLTGSVLIAQTYDFSAAISEPYWALAFGSLGNAYPNVVTIEEALFYASLQVYPTNLPTVNSTTAQFSDQYQTPSGLVQTQWQVAFDHSAKTITVQNLMTKLPQSSSFQRCTEILLAYWKMTALNYASPPSQITLPF